MKLFRKQKPNQTERRRPGGQVNPAVFSYYARSSGQSDQNTGRREEPNVSKRPKLNYQPRFGHIPSYIALVAIVVAVLYSCWLQPKPRIILISQPGTIHRDSKAYQTAVEAVWRRSLLNQTKLTVNTQNIRSDVRKQFSELSDVRIELPLLGRRATVTLYPQAPTLQFVSSNGAFFVDRNGVVMARVSDVTQNQISELALVRDETGASAEPGKSILSGTETQFLEKLFRQLRVQNITPESISLPQKSANEADVRIPGQAYYIKFSTDTEPRQAVGTYLAAKAKLDADHITPAEYLDVRVDEKVFYK